MRWEFPKDRLYSPLPLLRKAGYFAFIDPNTQKESFILRLGSDYYPRYHLYIEETDQDWVFDLHLDQKKPSYQGTRKHAGEYEGSAVTREMHRIAQWVAAETHYYHPELPGAPAPNEPKQEQAPDKREDSTPKPKSDLFGGIFG